MHKTVGILGGMGPEATATFFQEVIARTPAKKDQDHLKIVVVNDPTIPDRSAHLLDAGPSPVPALRRAAQDLQRLGADFIAIPCNTAHVFYEAITAAVTIPVLNIVEETLKPIVATTLPGGKVAVFATPATIRLRLYQKALEAEGFSAWEPDSATQEMVSRCIWGVKGACDRPLAKAALEEAFAAAAKAGATSVILGCTELGLARARTNLNVFDSLILLAQACVETARGERSPATPEPPPPRSMKA